MSTFTLRRFRVLRRLGLGLLLLALPACGLSDYEEQARAAQQRAERFHNEKKFLDQPVQMPEVADKDGKKMPAANVFYRPPKGIGVKPSAEPREKLMWRYLRQAGGEFIFVELAFAQDNNNFANDVLRNYQAAETFPTPEHTPPLPFDTWEFNDAQYGYSVNVLKNSRTQVAVVFVFTKGQHKNLRTAMDLSLQSLAVDQNADAARRRNSAKSPWRLKPAP